MKKNERNGNAEGRNGYKAFYREKEIEVYANSSFEAREKAAGIFKAKKNYEVFVVLCEKDGEPVVHVADF